MDDVNTVLDSEASVGERIWVGASILPVGKPLKLIKAGGVIKFADKGKHYRSSTNLEKTFENPRQNLTSQRSLIDAMFQ
ncbi:MULTISPECIES: hypothetical protein [Clostridia]|uniref:hypothetical protein n=1 Tax=Clostridia TaxID=186801 RepID=UPI0018F30721|nr:MULTISPECIES: hypothetical protein [Clostridia]